MNETLVYLLAGVEKSSDNMMETEPEGEVWMLTWKSSRCWRALHFTRCRCANLETLINVTVVTEPVKKLVDNKNDDKFPNKTNPLIRTGW